MIKKTPYIWGTDKPYNDYASYIKSRFENRLQKISVDAGFSCPNRDGEKGRGGWAGAPVVSADEFAAMRRAP